MKTRNQLNTKVVPETNNNVTRHIEDTSCSGDPPKRSPSPPRLRDRRSLSIEGKHNPSNITSPTNSHQASGPPANVKQRPSGPTRVLPRRSCAATSLLLNSYIVANSSHNRPPKQSTSKSPDGSQTSFKKDTHNFKQPTSEAQQPNGVVRSTDTEMLAINMKTANIKNYSRDVPPSKNTEIPKPTKSSGNSLLRSNVIKTKLVRISLPDKTRLDANNPIDLATSSKQTDKSRYIFAMNGLRKIGSESPDKTINDIANNNNSFGKTSSCNEVSQVSASISVKKKVFNVLLAVTGSVATIKLVELAKKIDSTLPKTYLDKTTGDKMEACVNIKIVMTKNSMHFAPKDQVEAELANSKIEIFEDADEWSTWKKMGDPVLHIELRKWADLCLIAPLDANTMAKLANGICDNLLTCIVRAWDLSKPLIYCPAMNVHMYNHPITKEQISKLQSHGYLRVDCVEKRLACGDVGMGAMASIDTIAQKVIDCLIQPVSQRASPTRPLLNQQPTYTIMPTPGHNEESSNNPVSRATSRGSIFDRFKTNNQISIHAVPSSSLQSAGPSLLERKRNLNLGGSKDLNLPPHITNRPPNSSNNINMNQISSNRSKMGGVTSVQNLKAMGIDNGPMEVERESLNDEEHRFDLDPTKLLEQSMVTDDHASSSIQSNSFERNLITVDTSYGKTGSLTPLFNTSKFLALCFNKERGDFTCAICKHDYKNRKSMARHLKEQHVQGNIFHCKPCGVSYKRREKLIKHNRERHPEKV